MLWVPRSWAASPWVIERTMVSLSMIFAVWGRYCPSRTPGTLVQVKLKPKYGGRGPKFGITGPGYCAAKLVGSKAVPTSSVGAISAAG